MDWASEGEFLRRAYNTQDFRERIPKLWNYFKYHRDFPRYFEMPHYRALMDYYDRVRKEEYRMVSRMNRPPKIPRLGVPLDRILKDLDPSSGPSLKPSQSSHSKLKSASFITKPA